MRRPIVYAVAAATAAVVVAAGAALAVDSRLDRQLTLRLGTLALALLCAAVLAFKKARKGSLIIAAGGLAIWGVIAPIYTTVWSTPPEIEFAMAVATDAKDEAQRSAQSAVGVQEVTAAAQRRGGAVGTLKDGARPVVGADAFPLVLRPDPARARPRVCLTFEHGLDAKIRAC